MKKLKISLLIIVLMVFTLNVKTFAASLQATIDITPDKTEAKPGEYVTFNIKIKDIANADGGTVSAIGGVINYNTNFFEPISQEDTTATINTTTGAFNLTFVASSERDVGTIKLKVKSNPTGEGTVSFTKLTASDGETETAETSKNITIALGTNSGEGGNSEGGNSGSQGGNSEGGNNGSQEGNSEGGNGGSQGEKTSDGKNEQDNILPIKGNSESSTSSNSKDDDTTATKIIPKTGVRVTTVVIISILSVISVVAFKKYRYYRDIK